MRTSHKHTHTRPPVWLASGWLRLLVTVLFLGGLAFVVTVRSGLWTAKANEVEAARARLEKAQAEYRANPTEPNQAALMKAASAYKSIIAATPAAQSVVAPTFGAPKAFAVSAKASEIVSTPSPSAAAGKLGLIRGSELNELPLRNADKNKPTSSSNVQNSLPPGQALVSAPIASFDGLSANDDQLTIGTRFAPPDTVADVDNDQIVECVNSVFRVFAKNGTPQTGVVDFNVFFAPIGGATAAFSDPIVLYDPLADRWMLLMWDTNGADMYFGISTTNDAAGSYFLYVFTVYPNRLPDYPHVGVWHDGYYMTTNNFNAAGTAFTGGGMQIFERQKMLAGDPTAQFVAFEVATSGGLSPADVDGVAPPPATAPGFFMEFRADEYGDPFDAIRIFEGRPNWSNPALSTLTQLPDLAAAAFDPRSVGDFVSTRAEVEQAAPATAADALQSLSGRLMHRTAYRTLAGGVQSFVLNFTVNVSGVTPNSVTNYQAGVRWMELRRSAGGTFSVANQATFAPGAGVGNGGREQFMASIAQDGEGNTGLAYSLTQRNAPAINTGMAYTGRLAADAANSLPQGEQIVPLTNTSQIGTGNRWGDYSSLSVDPTDECTFWGANEYVSTTPPGGFTTFNWSTRIFSFKVNPSCVPAAKATIQGTATTLIGGTPISAVNVTATGGLYRSTNASGQYSMSVAPGTYTVTCAKAGLSTVTGNVTVAAGQTATFDCQMSGVPVLSNGGSTVASESCSTDGRFDPGETVTINLCVTNTGGAPTTNLIGTLQATGGVVSPSAPQNFGAVPPNGVPVCRSFTFTVNPALACGSNVVLTLNLQDGASSFGPFTYNYGSGSPIIGLAENFDGVTAPALPAGWAATNATGAAPLWVTSTATPDSAPNAAFVDDPAALSDKQLTTPAVNFSGASAFIQFRNNFNLESGFDGGVLEVSVNNGAFVDVTSLAGASFISGGYTAAISTGFSSPIAGRSAWTGNSGGYITTRVNLGGSLAGQSARFRFRMGSDTSVAGTGWRVDNVQIENGFSCCVQLARTSTLADPAACTGPGNNVAGTVTATNPVATALTGSINVALPAGLVGTDGCVSNFGTCTVTPTAINWSGTIPGNSTLTINYIAQVGDVPTGTSLCVQTTGNFPGSGFAPIQTCITVNCQQAGPGGIIPTITPEGASPSSDQKPGSILIYPIYTSGSDPIRQNTRISLTNIHTVRSAFVHLYFVDGSTCSVADAFICLTPNQTTSFLASDLDPGTTGYIMAMAVNGDGCPINFNYLIGDEYVKFSSGHAGSIGAESVPALPGSFTVCTSQATVRFDGFNYAPLPRTVALDNIPSRADGNDTLLVLDRIGGDLLTTASRLNNLFGLLYNDAEIGLSFSLRPNQCQLLTKLDNNFPRTTPRFDQFVPAGRSAWLKIYSTDDMAIVGAAFNFNPNFNASANAFNGGHSLHKLTLTNTANVIVPVLPVSCQ